MKTVLIAEDHPDMLEVLAWHMERMGYSVISAMQGGEAVEKAAREKPDLILMDIMMPGMDGLEASRIIRSDPDTQDVPILAATVLFTEADLRNCIDAGCNDYIVKPFTFKELQRKIKVLMPASGGAI